MDYRELAKGINVHETGNPVDSFPTKPYPPKVGSYEIARETKKAEHIKQFLKDWNPRVRFKFEELEAAIEEVKPTLQTLSTFSIHNIDLREKIKESGLTWHNTNASKVLHVLAPQIFVMWDQDIREAYGCYGNEEGYYNFHIRMQMELNEIIMSYQKDYGCGREEAVKQICQRFYENGAHPITKLLDIYNHEKYTRKKF